MKIKGQSIFTILIMMASLSATLVALQWDFKTALAPAFCGGVIFTLCFFQLLRELKGIEGKSTQIMDSGFDKGKTTDRENLLGAIRYFGILGGLYISIWIIGLYPSIGFFAVINLLASRRVSVIKSLMVAAGTVGLVYFIINQIAQETLPDPFLYRLLVR